MFGGGLIAAALCSGLFKDDDEDEDIYVPPDMPEPAPNEVYVLFDSLLNPAPEIMGKDNTVIISLRGHQTVKSLDFGDGNIFYQGSAQTGGLPYAYTTSGTYLIKLTADTSISFEHNLYQCCDTGYGSIRAIKIGSDINIVSGDRPFTNKGKYNNIGVEYIKSSKLSGISEYEFNNCYNLHKVDLYNCTSLGYAAFRFCYNLLDIDLPKCTEIESSAFESCYNLKTINLPICKDLGVGAFSECHKIKKISLPNCISIDNNAFYECSGLKVIDLPSLKTAGNGVFANCSKLEEIELPNCISIGNEAFKNCYSLKSVKLPKCTSVGQNAFTNCGSLRELILSN